jgi:hypothetical protein
LFTQSRTLRTTQLLGLNSSTGWFDLAAPDRIVARTDFHRPSRAPGPRQQLRKSSSAAGHLHIINNLPAGPIAFSNFDRHRRRFEFRPKERRAEGDRFGAIVGSVVKCLALLHVCR